MEKLNKKVLERVYQGKSAVNLVKEFDKNTRKELTNNISKFLDKIIKKNKPSDINKGTIKFICNSEDKEFVKDWVRLGLGLSSSADISNSMLSLGVSTAFKVAMKTINKEKDKEKVLKATVSPFLTGVAICYTNKITANDIK